MSARDARLPAPEARVTEPNAPIREPAERLAARPWRIMEWLDAGDARLRYKTCADAYQTWSEAVSALMAYPGAWIESAPENVIQRAP